MNNHHHPSPPRGSIVTSGGARYERSPVGDRLEYSTPRPKNRPPLSPEVYREYMTGGKNPAPRRPEKNSRSSVQNRRRWRGGSKREFEEVPPGISIRDVVRKFIPRLSVRLTVSGLAALIVGILAYNIFMSFYVEYRTETVTMQSYLETIDVEGVAIREETVLEGTLSDTSVKAVRNGDKISKGEPVVNIFRTSEEAAAYERIAEINRDIQELGNMLTASEDSANSVDNIGRLLDNKMVELNKCASGRTAEGTDRLKRDISYLLNKRMVITRQADDYSTRITQLQKESQELQRKYSKEPKTVTSEYSGYFNDTCDGYEKLLTTAKVKSLTVEKLEKIMSQEVSPPENVIGKVITSFTWYLACPVPVLEADHLIVNSLYTLYLPYSESESVEAVLECLNKSNDRDQCLAVFRCNALASELSTVRSQPVKIRKYSYEGFAIKKSALHVGVREESIRNPHAEEDFPRAHLVYVRQVTYPSVYVVVAGQVNEKEVIIARGTDNTVICIPNTSSSRYLSLKDKVVTEERGLYDGKLVR